MSPNWSGRATYAWSAGSSPGLIPLQTTGTTYRNTYLPVLALLSNPSLVTSQTNHTNQKHIEKYCRHRISASYSVVWWHIMAAKPLITSCALLYRLESGETSATLQPFFTLQLDIQHEVSIYTHHHQFCSPIGYVCRSVPDPHVFRPPGSGSMSQMYGSVSFYHQTKIVRKTLIPTVLWLLLDFLSLKNDVNVPS